MLLQRNLVVRIVTCCNLARSTGEVHGSPFFRQEQRSVLQEPSLRNTVNGVVAPELSNVHNEEVARAIMHNMTGKPVYTCAFTFKRNEIAITFGETSAVRIASDRTIYS